MAILEETLHIKLQANLSAASYIYVTSARVCQMLMCPSLIQYMRYSHKSGFFVFSIPSDIFGRNFISLTSLVSKLTYTKHVICSRDEFSRIDSMLKQANIVETSTSKVKLISYAGAWYI